MAKKYAQFQKDWIVLDIPMCLSQERRGSNNRETEAGKETRDLNGAGWSVLWWRGRENAESNGLHDNWFQSLTADNISTLGGLLLLYLPFHIYWFRDCLFIPCNRCYINHIIYTSISFHCQRQRKSNYRCLAKSNRVSESNWKLLLLRGWHDVQQDKKVHYAF